MEELEAPTGEAKQEELSRDRLRSRWRKGIPPGRLRRLWVLSLWGRHPFERLPWLRGQPGFWLPPEQPLPDLVSTPPGGSKDQILQ